MTAGAVSLVLGLLVIAWVVLIYNRLATLRHRVLNAYAQLDRQLVQRQALIARLVERIACRGEAQGEEHRALQFALLTVRKHAQQAASIARHEPMRAEAITAFARADADLRLALTTFRRQHPGADASPEDDDEGVATLLAALDAVEQRADYALESHRVAATDFNAACARYPERLVAARLGFRPVALFDGRTVSVAAPLQTVCP